VEPQHSRQRDFHDYVARLQRSGIRRLRAAICAATSVRLRSSRPAQLGPGFWGHAGAAIRSDGRLLVETGDGPYDVGKNLLADSVISLSPKDRKLTD
jgi:hypothetical protein